MPASTRRRASSPITMDVEGEEVEGEEGEEDGEEEGESEGDGEGDGEEMGDQENGEGTVAQLRFNKALTWKAGKPITVTELLKRLEELSRELKQYDQDEVERQSMVKVATELASRQLLSHKESGVKAYTACCLVDMFRLCAPDAPYTAPQLKDIFTLFIQTILPALADPSSPYNGQHLYVLKSLAEVKSVILLTDLPGSANIVQILFKQCFDVLGGPSKANSGEELSKNVEHYMTSILSTLVDESQNLPPEVVETILAQFLRTNPRVAGNGVGKGKKAVAMEETQGTLLWNEAPPAYNMAKNVCNSSADKMGRYVARYFNGIIIDASTAVCDATATGKKSKKRVSEDAGDPDDEVAAGFADLGPTRKAHELLRELWRSCPSILQELIPQQLEPELTAANVDLRLLAVETVADMISGIGHAGPPQPTPLNPAAYPSQSLVEASAKQDTYNFLTTPSSPISFISRYFQTYLEFVNRRNDKSPVIRAAWATAVGRILMTSAGGVGLDAEEEGKLLNYFANTLLDLDDKVRFNAIQAVERFDFDKIIEKLGSHGGLGDAGSLLSNLAQRAKDKKQVVRTEAIRLLAKIWGVAAGAIAAGSDRVSKLLGPIPSTILEACYINDADIHALVDRVLYESLLPYTYPSTKSKSQVNGQSQRVKESQNITESDAEFDPDKVRTERILLLVRDLEPKAKAVFFSRQSQQTDLAKYMSLFLQNCEHYNGGVMDKDKDEKAVKGQLGKLVDFFSGRLPEPAKVSEDLWKFAKMHDRRSYQLIRFCMAAESDYRKVARSIRELTKRIEEANGATTSLLDTITILVYRCSILLYNRSHVPAIIDFSRTDENGLGVTAHEVLKEISKNKSEVFKAHVQDLCKSLEAEAPSATKPGGHGAVDDLKACVEFARKFPDDIPKERKFIQAMMGFVGYANSPKAAKYAAFIILNTADRKEMYVKDIFKMCAQDFKYGSGNYLTHLAALSQLVLLGSDCLASDESDENDENDVIVDIAINQVLTNPDATPAPEEGDPDPAWLESPDENCAAKIWALKILVNGLRGYDVNDPVFDDATKRVFQFLHTLVQKHGQITKSRPSPAAHQSRLRLVASQLLLKLCCEKRFNQRLTPAAFNALATVAMDSNEHVRAGFVNKIMKYIGQSKLTVRFYTPLFLLGHEPEQSIRNRATTWLKSRAAAFARQKDTSMETIFARLMSLLAHHPDWPAVGEEMDEDEKIDTLKVFMGFIIFYLKCIATRENISLIFHIAQRIKAVQDGIVPRTDTEALKAMNSRLYMLSDLSQEVIRKFEEIHGWNVQAWPGKVAMPAGVFMVMPDHDTAQSVAMKQHVPESLLDQMDHLVKDALRTKKRKSEKGDNRVKKRTKTSATTAGAEKKARKFANLKLNTPKGKMETPSDAPSSEPTRKSSRAANHKSYIEISDEEEVDDAKSSDDEDKDEDEDEDEDMAHADESEVDKAFSDLAVEVDSAADHVQEEEGGDEEESEELEASVPMHSASNRKSVSKKGPGVPPKSRGTPSESRSAKARSVLSLVASPLPAAKTNARPTRGSTKEKAVYAMSTDSEDEDDELQAPTKVSSKPQRKTNTAPVAKPPVKPTTGKSKAAGNGKVNAKVNAKAKAKGRPTKARAKAKPDLFDVPDSD